MVQAWEEQVLRLARTETIKESMRDYFAELRSLLETWVANVRAPSPPSFDRYPLSASEQAEQNRLFEGLREHLPFPELWRNYQTLKLKWNEYTTTYEGLHRQVIENAGEKWELSLLKKFQMRPEITKWLLVH